MRLAKLSFASKYQSTGEQKEEGSGHLNEFDSRFGYILNFEKYVAYLIIKILPILPFYVECKVSNI